MRVAARGDGRRRVAFVNSHPIQYFAPLYAHINRSPDIEAVPIYLSDISLRGGFDKGFGQTIKWDIDLLAGANPIFVRDAARNDPADGLKLLAPEIWSIVRRGDFDAVVVHGAQFSANEVAVLAAKSVGVPVIVRGETHLGLERSGMRANLRNLLVHRFYRQFDAFLTIGTRNREFYRSLGIPHERLFDFPYTVDNARMASAASLDAARISAVRQRYGIATDRPAVLFASKFTRRKHPDDLIAAAARLAATGMPFALVMAGAGEMDAELRALADAHPQLNTVFTGFVNQAALPELFGACDVFVLPSEQEPWGLIINEAMAAGLPIIASREIGAVADLVRHGENGVVIDARDVDALTDALTAIVGDPKKRSAMSRASRRIIAGWSYVEAEAGLRAAVDYLSPTGQPAPAQRAQLS